MLGAIIGDMVGSVYEWNNLKSKDFTPLFHARAKPTDDSVLTIAVADSLLNDRLPVEAFKDWGRRYPECGWGGRFKRWLFSDETGPYGSFGNGAAMRVSPAALLGKTLDETLASAKRVTEITHDHPEGLKGAAATAHAIFLAFEGEALADIRMVIQETYGYDLQRTVDDIRPDYTFDVTCQGSVPEALICVFEATDFEDAIRNAISIGGDSDTLAAIAGGFAEAHFGIPPEIAAEAWQRLPADMRDILEALYNNAHRPPPVRSGWTSDRKLTISDINQAKHIAPLFRRTWTTSELLEQHRPHHTHSNKALLFDLALDGGSALSGSVTLSRWPASPLPTSLGPSREGFKIAAMPGHFRYSPSSQVNAIEWHLNFADFDAFATWRTPLFAQDEIQVAEHPALAALHLEARDQGISMKTVEETTAFISHPTPVLVSGVERRIEVETATSGLYGNAFQRASLEQVRQATRIIDPPSISHILAIQAPEPGSGLYKASDIRQILITAYSGFVAAIEEGKLQKGANSSTLIHSGFWGCGAYGGNRTLMLLLQMLAAHLSGVQAIQFHIGRSSSKTHHDEALALYEQIASNPDTTVGSTIAWLEERGFTWGVSDGN